MAWFYLTVAGLFEIGWAIGLKYSDGFSKPVPSLITVASLANYSCSDGIEHLVVVSCNEDHSSRHGVRSVDRYWCGRCSNSGHAFIWRVTGNIENYLPVFNHRGNNRA